MQGEFSPLLKKDCSARDTLTETHSVTPVIKEWIKTGLLILSSFLIYMSLAYSAAFLPGVLADKVFTHRLLF
jgi:hypothetical protein